MLDSRVKKRNMWREQTLYSFILESLLSLLPCLPVWFDLKPALDRPISYLFFQSKEFSQSICHLSAFLVPGCYAEIKKQVEESMQTFMLLIIIIKSNDVGRDLNTDNS